MVSFQWSHIFQCFIKTEVFHYTVWISLCSPISSFPLKSTSMNRSPTPLEKVSMEQKVSVLFPLSRIWCRKANLFIENSRCCRALWMDPFLWVYMQNVSTCMHVYADIPFSPHAGLILFPKFNSGSFSPFRGCLQTFSQN